MKTAYELAMERLGKTGSMPKLSEEQKKALAELDSIYRARLAEREIALNGLLTAAEAEGDLETIEKLRAQLASERKKILAELEEKKEAVRQQSPSSSR
jgi:hypothetical protein